MNNFKYEIGEWVYNFLGIQYQIGYRRYNERLKVNEYKFVNEIMPVWKREDEIHKTNDNVFRK